MEAKAEPPYEASGEAPPQPRLSREDKGKLPIRFGSFAEAINRDARLVTLPSPNLRAVTPCTNLVLPSDVSDGVANSAPVPQAANKAPQVLRSPNPQALSPLFEVKLRDHPWVLIAVLMQLQRLRVLPELSAAELELKHYPMPIASVAMKRTRHRPVLRFQGLRMLSPPLIKL